MIMHQILRSIQINLMQAEINVAEVLKTVAECVQWNSWNLEKPRGQHAQQNDKNFGRELEKLIVLTEMRHEWLARGISFPQIDLWEFVNGTPIADPLAIACISVWGLRIPLHTKANVTTTAIKILLGWVQQL